MTEEPCKNEVPEAVRAACETLCAYLQIDGFKAASATMWHDHKGVAHRIRVETKESYCGSRGEMATARNDALEEAAEALRGDPNLYREICCSGRDCGCYGATADDYVQHAIRALKCIK